MDTRGRLSVAALLWGLAFSLVGTLVLYGTANGRLPARAFVSIGVDEQWRGLRGAWLRDETMRPWRGYILEAASRFNVPAPWIAAVIRVESRGLTHWDGEPVVSAAGAVGLMQVLPDTYAVLSDRHDLGPDPHEPHDNILAGTAYLRLLYDIYGFPGFLGAYNAGPGRYGAHLFHDGELPGQTQIYMTMILPHIEGIYPDGEHGPRPPDREAYDRLVASAL